MDIHENARLTPHGRERLAKMIVGGQPPEGIASLRRQRMPGNEIAATVGVSPATVSRVLKRLRLSKLSTLEPAEPPRRYQREQPGEMILTEISSAAVTEGAASCARGA
jgi:hypothetical protein